MTSFDDFYPTFEAMEKHDMVLNIHGEVPGIVPDGVTHEEAFLPTLLKLNEKFPKLRIVLEHCSTAAAIEAVGQCGPTVGGTHPLTPASSPNDQHLTCPSYHHRTPPLPDQRH